MVENHKSPAERPSLAMLSCKTALFGMLELNGPQGGSHQGFIL